MKSSQKLADFLSNGRIILDGGTGTVLQSMGLPAGCPPEMWNFFEPKKIEELHLSYLRAGSDIIASNTFGVNANKYEKYDEYIRAALEIANRARERYYAEGGIGDKLIALDIGPSGRMLAPLGDLEFEDAVELFAKTVRAGASYGADIIFIETMNDSYETKAAVLAAKENSDLPIFVSNVYDESSKLMTGASPEAMVAMLEGLGVCALGVNCSLGPDKLLPTVRRLCDAASVPVIVKPNAGLPTLVDGESVFSITPREFATEMREMATAGAVLLGGCCGTTPAYIKEMREMLADIPTPNLTKKNKCVFSSYTHALIVGDRPLLVGERINPTGKPKLKEALREGNISYLLSEAIAEEESGADALDVNVGLPGINEPEMMRRAVREIQAVTSLPLQIDSGDAVALESAMRIYNGKPLVNSVNGKEESLRSVLPLVKKYGGVLIALTLDENGVPADTEGRVRIAERIIATAGEYGIGTENIIFDPLAMAVSADKNAAAVTLDTVRELSARGYYTSLGVSNVSFGLPERDKINSAFFTMALSAGLDLAIMNPHSRAMQDAYHAYLALSAQDEGFAEYIPYAEANKALSTTVGTQADKPSQRRADTLYHAVLKGFRAEASRLAKEALSTRDALDVINGEMIPALTKVGEDFEAGRAYLPGLLMSAEAALAAFEVVRGKMPKGTDSGKRIILATVKGDIHDIGKNIVKVVLESYGFAVVDLGKDVAPEKILDAVKTSGIHLVGLSALMTTTVPAMEETVKLLHDNIPDCKVIVGGAVMTGEYAEMMGADLYAEDAMDAVRKLNGLEKAN